MKFIKLDINIPLVKNYQNDRKVFHYIKKSDATVETTFSENAIRIVYTGSFIGFYLNKLIIENTFNLDSSL